MIRYLKWTLTAAVLALALASCDGEPDDGPYMAFIGGGFIFNYNVADAYYGFVARRQREVPPGTLLEARFEDPGGGMPFLVTATVLRGRRDYVFRSPSLRGIEAGRDYLVELRLVDPADRRVLARYTKTYRSDLDQSVLPERPTTIGPGYQPNPATEKPPV